MSKIKNLIDSRFHTQLLNHGEIELVDAKDLITSERLDIAVKYRYVQYLIEKNNDKRSELLYKEHLNIISNGTFIEPGDENKSSINDYKKTFIDLIDSIKEGFCSSKSIVPLSRNGIPLDGAHRIAVCAVLGIKIQIVRLDVDDFLYDHEFFKRRVTPGYLFDEFFYTYLKITNEEVSLVIEWPTKKNISKLIKQKFTDSLIYSKSMNLKYNGVKNIMLMNYWGENWLGGVKVNNLGINNKVTECFKGGVTHFYWIKGLNLKDRIKNKESIRNDHDGTKHIMHSTDSKTETMNVSSSLLTEDSETMLNLIDPALCSRSLDNLLKISGQYDRDKMVIGGSFILSLLGIREANDIDVVHESITLESCAGSHNDLIELYGFTDFCCIYEPSNYFYYFGYKFFMPKVILDMKTKRGEVKDKLDVINLGNSMENNKPSLSNRARKAYLYLLRNFVVYSIKIIKLLGLKETVKYILKKYS